MKKQNCIYFRTETLFAAIKITKTQFSNNITTVNKMLLSYF